MLLDRQSCSRIVYIQHILSDSHWSTTIQYRLCKQYVPNRLYVITARTHSSRLNYPRTKSKWLAPACRFYYVLSFPMSLSAKKTPSCPSSHFTSSLLSPGPPAQWPHIDGNTSSRPTPAFMFATSYSESSGLAGSFCLIELQETHGGRDWI